MIISTAHLIWGRPRDRNGTIIQPANLLKCAATLQPYGAGGAVIHEANVKLTTNMVILHRTNSAS